MTTFLYLRHGGVQNVNVLSESVEDPALGCGVEKGHWRPEDGGESGVVQLLGSTDGAQVQEYRSKDHSYGLLGNKDKQLDQVYIPRLN